MARAGHACRTEGRAVSDTRESRAGIEILERRRGMLRQLVTATDHRLELRRHEYQTEAEALRQKRNQLSEELAAVEAALAELRAKA